MRLFAKAALGALALASVGAVAATPANAQFSIQVGPPAVVVPDRNPCFRPPEFRPAFCFRHHPEGWAWGRRDFGAYAYNYDRRDFHDFDRERERERERQAMLDQRYRDYYGR